MGYELSRWAQREDHPCLTARTRQVLLAICMVAHDEHGEFWMRPRSFIAEYLPGMSYGAYRNHLMALVRNEILIKVEQGGGRTTHGRGKTTRYRVNSPAVRNPQPAQGVLPEIARSPEAKPVQPEEERPHDYDAAIEVYEHIDELLSSGVAPAEMLAILRVVSDTFSKTRNPSDAEGEPAVSERNLSENVTGLDDTERNLSENVTGLDDTERNLSENVTGLDGSDEKPVSFSTTSQRNLSGNLTGPPIHEEKILEEKEDHAAAAINLSGSELTSFFEVLTAALDRAGHGGIRPTQFADLTCFLADYADVTGSPPDESTADYIAGRVSESKGVRNVVGFARKITQDVLTTGEGFLASAAREPPPAERPERDSAPEPPDWNLLHLAHGEQVAQAQGVWDAVLEALRSQVSRPAFETWLSESRGVAYVEGQFVVGTQNRFIAEMLGHRLHPIIERAVRDATGTELAVQYAVEPQGGELCLICEGVQARAEAS